MKTLKWGLALLLLSVTSVATAQFTQKWIAEAGDPDLHDEFNGMCEDGEGGIIAVGQQLNSDTGQYEALFARFNEQGELIWRETYSAGPNASVEFMDVAQYPYYADYFVAVGRWEDDQDQFYQITMLSINGTVGNSAAWGFAGGGVLNSVERNASGLIACGTTREDSPNPLGIVIKFNDPLEISWWNTFGTYDNNRLYEIRSVDLGYIATGTGFQGNEKHAWTLRIDLNGSEMWSTYHTGYPLGVGFSAMKTYNADFITAGYSNSGDGYEYLVILQDGDGNEIWGQTYGVPDGFARADWIGIAPTGGFYVLGDLDNNDDSIWNDVWLLHIDYDGNVIDDQLFIRPDMQYTGKALMMNDTDPVLVGSEAPGPLAYGDAYAMWLTPTQDIETFIDASAPPVNIPYPGGSFAYQGTGVNNTNSVQQVDAWIQVLHLQSQLSVETRLFENLNLPANSQLSASLVQQIPLAAPEGEYRIVVFLGDHPWDQVATDWFTFRKYGPTLADADLSVFKQPELWSVTGTFEDQVATETDEESDQLPDDFALSAYPNPFNPTTTVTIALPEATDLQVRVFNTNGRLVSTLAEGQLEAGNHAFQFDGTSLAGGVYFVTVTTPIGNSVRKVVLMK